MWGRCGRSPGWHGGARPPGGHRSRQQDRGRRHFLPVNLASVHVAHGPLGVGRVLELDVGEPPRQVAVGAVGGQLDALDGPVAAKDLQQVVACHVARQTPHVDLAGARRRRSALATAAAAASARCVGGGRCGVAPSAASPAPSSAAAGSTPRPGDTVAAAPRRHGRGARRRGGRRR